MVFEAAHKGDQNRTWAVTRVQPLTIGKVAPSLPSASVTNTGLLQLVSRNSSTRKDIQANSCQSVLPLSDRTVLAGESLIQMGKSATSFWKNTPVVDVRLQTTRPVYFTSGRSVNFYEFTIRTAEGWQPQQGDQGLRAVQYKPFNDLTIP